MAIFLVVAAAMIAAALAFVVLPLLRHRSGAHAPDAAARRLHALDAALAAGVVDAEEYAAKRAQHAAPGTPSRPSRVAFAALIAVTLLLPASAFLLYRLVGAPQALEAANRMAEPPPAGGASGPQMDAAIAKLVARLKEHPDEVEGWALLGRAYAATGRPADALDAFRHAHAAAPDNAAITVEYAQALALAAPGHRIEGESRSLLESVLKTDPTNQRTLWLLGISDYQGAHYAAAIARWNTLLPLLAPDSSVRESVQKQIVQAQALRDGRAPPDASTTMTAESAAPRIAPSDASAPSSADAGAPRLTVSVALDPKLKGRLDPDATLFVYARAAKGPPMPLAIQRLKASQLPLTVTLDDSMGMLPTMKLSMFPEVVIGARVSRSGNALAQSGDLQSLSAPTDVHRTAPTALVIDQVVP